MVKASYFDFNNDLRAFSRHVNNVNMIAYNWWQVGMSRNSED
jgi:hypothetical protein